MQSLGVAGFAVLLLALAAGWVKLPLPYPAVKQYAQDVPSSVYPWRPSAIDQGLFKVRHKLQPTKLFQGQIHGSESVNVSPDGRLVMIDKYGAVRAAPKQPIRNSTQLDPQPIAHLGPGRALGFTFDADGNLVVCDALKGLIMYNMTSKQVQLLTNRVSSSSRLQPGSLINYANDLDIAADGTIYFTDSVNISPHRNAQHTNNVTHIVTIRGESGFYDTFKGWALGMLQGLPQGRLLAYYPKTRTTHVLANGLYYSNGVALSKDESYVAVSETDQLRVLKFYLPPHPRAGQHEVLIDKLPGTPDGVSRAHDGSFWVSLIADIPGFTKWFGLPVVRGILGHIPENWRPQLPTWGAVLKVSESGQLLQWLVDLKGETVSKISSAHEHGDRLYLGNLAGDYVSYVNLADLPPDGAVAEQ